MSNFRTTLTVQGKEFDTLSDILPEKGCLEILFIAKTPPSISVNKGHYFQGRQGTMFWNMLSKYGILKVPNGMFADECLLSNNYGITDIVKVPRNYGDERSREEYIAGLPKILSIIYNFKPRVIVFVYKSVADNITKINFNLKTKSNYGFNPQLEQHFKSKVFVFPMSGTPCKTSQAVEAMTELKTLLSK